MTIFNEKKMLLLSAILCAVTMVAVAVVNAPFLAGALGISTSSAIGVVNLLSAYSTVTAVISIIGAVTGVGSIGSGIAATVLYIIKQKGKAQAALW